MAVLALALLASPAIASALPPFVLWGVLPTTAAVAVLGLSAWALVRRATTTQILLGTITASLCASSLWTLKRIFVDGAGATYFPYYALALAVPMALLQWVLLRRHENRLAA